ncbi:Universal stress protein family protein [Phycisphaerae bacterium RAS1]|nr:Universal stress protein family protein [Phycisphaerae bacterium RAS1]
MIVHSERPRDLRWYHAGPMLFGDLGTSRLYVMGLAFFHAGLAAPYHVAAISALILLVGWAYTVVCRLHPDGGGVYTSARAVHPVLGVFGATLLFADYVVTAAISGYEALAYIGGPLGLPREAFPYLTAVALLLIGALNYIGPRRAGTFALYVALGSFIAASVIVAASIPSLDDGLRAMHAPRGAPTRIWTDFVAVVLALSGIEAVASMTGIMVQPVARTSRRAIWPVVAEVILFNILLAVAFCGLPHLEGGPSLADKEHARKAWESLPRGAQQAQPEPPALTEHEHALYERSLDVLARQRLGPVVASIASVIFGLLLLSACNTAILGLIGVQYVMSRDGELPRAMSRLNSFGVPWVGLLPACVLPIAIVLLTRSVNEMADLYAIGVVGAIIINVACTAVTGASETKTRERLGLWTTAAVLGVIWVTIAVTKPMAAAFLCFIVVGGLGLRFVSRPKAAARPTAPAAPPTIAPPPTPTALRPFDPSKPKILVASRGNPSIVRFAIEEARHRDANVFLLFVREVNVTYGGPIRTLSPDEDPDARQLFADAQTRAVEADVPLQLIYSAGGKAADAILDFAATYAVDLVILGVSRRAALLRALHGDVITTVADHLPVESTLLIHA